MASTDPSSHPTTGRTLTHAEARAFYDRFGKRQDWQAFYEDRAVTALLEHLDLGAARRVIELGAGTGRVAARLLGDRLPAGASYLGLDVSRTMVELARSRLEPWAERVEVRLTEGDMATGEPAASCDRFLAVYVLDLLSAADIARAVDEAHRVLGPGGRLGAVSLTSGDTAISRGLCRAWSAVHRLRPQLVGGCRPVEIAPHLDPTRWRLLHRSIVGALGLRSEVVVAEPI